MELKDYNLYTIFLKAVELKNYSRVAEVVGLSSHKVVSEKMKLLEEKLGTKLFVRSFRSMEPTSDALVLYEKVKKALQDIELAEDNAKGFGEESHAVIRVGAPSTIMSVVLKDFIKTFCKKYPNIELKFSGKSTEALSQSTIDLLIRYKCYFQDRGFIVSELFPLELCFIVSKDFYDEHNLTKAITIERFSKLKVIMHDDFSTQIKEDICNTPYITAPTREAIMSMVRSGLGIGCVFGDYELDDLIRINVEGLQNITQTLAIATNGNLSKAATAFKKEMFTFFGL